MADIAKHTAGPWLIRKAANGDRGISAPGTGIFIEVFTDIRHSSEFSLEECKANARLVAAAPDLLQALKKIVYDWDGEPEDMIEAAEAIAKAEGV
jgi:hypothetical protein